MLLESHAQNRASENPNQEPEQQSMPQARPSGDGTRQTDTTHTTPQANLTRKFLVPDQEEIVCCAASLGDLPVKGLQSAFAEKTISPIPAATNAEERASMHSLEVIQPVKPKNPDRKPPGASRTFSPRRTWQVDDIENAVASSLHTQ